MFWLALFTPRAFFWIAIAALCLAIGVQTVRLDHARTELAVEQAERAKEAAKLLEFAAQHARENVRLQAEHAAATQALSDVYEADRARLAGDNARLSADADGLRADVERYAAAGAGGAVPDAVACQRAAHRARTLGQLFGQADGLAESMARAAEQRNAEVRALKHQIAADRAACGADHGKSIN